MVVTIWAGWEISDSNPKKKGIAVYSTTTREGSSGAYAVLGLGL